MQFKSAILRIIDLAKINYFEKHDIIEGFNPSEVLEVSYSDTTLDDE